MVSPAVAPTEPEPVEEPQVPAEPAGGFSWSWGQSGTTEPDELDQVDVESGEAPEIADEEPAGEPATPDAIETDVLARDPDVSDDPDAVQAPEDAEDLADSSTSEALDTVDADEDSTLAAWAGQWSDEEADETTEITAGSDHTSVEPLGSRDKLLTRARNLLSELDGIIPQLAQPEAPAEQLDPGTPGAGLPLPQWLFEEVEAWQDADTFDDLRDAIAAAQANPREIDSMLRLSNSADRLGALLESHDALARSLTSLRQRLQQHAEGDGHDQGDYL